MTAADQRHSAYGQHRAPTPVDRFGVWLGARAARRAARFDGARLADFGCGYDANFTRTQLQALSHALVVDFVLADDLKHDPKVTTIEGSLPEVLPGLESQSLDIVICLSVLEHLWDPQTALEHFRRLLAPGGVAILNVPSWLGKPFLELAAFRLGVAPTQEMDDHKAYYDPRDLWPMLVRAGFKPSLIRCHRHKLGLNTSAVCRVP
ncbi:MAG TPA: methyltransferase domain-containing protein [Solirubrobacteraceae bacterium]|jgi:SAM-dependent methyltransferase|nr:methyltransferase domain-containing protein [Solirubrobacteraceae bacterium]